LFTDADLGLDQDILIGDGSSTPEQYRRGPLLLGGLVQPAEDAERVFVETGTWPGSVEAAAPESLIDRRRRQAFAFRDRVLAEPPPERLDLARIADPRLDPAWEPGEVTADDIAALSFAHAGWPEPEDRGLAVLSPLGDTEYVADLIRPGRIVLWAAEEGSGKSYSVDDELGIRVAVAGGSFAGTWDVLETGPVLYLSEMHGDDDFTREATVLESLGLVREQLVGRYYRLPLMMAAAGKPALMVPEWRAWAVEWLRRKRAVLLIFDTATGATQVDPWGSQIQSVYAGLRAMLDAYPALAIVLVVHLKKPNGHGERRLSDVLGEWGRWNDVTVLQENDGQSLARSRLSVRKRVRHERRIVATKAGGLLIDPVDLDEAKGTKVPTDAVLAAIASAPGIDYARLGKVLDVHKDTAGRYVAALVAAGQVETRMEIRPTVKGPRRVTVVYPVSTDTAVPPHTTAGTGAAVSAADRTADATGNRRTAARTYIGAAVPRAAVSASEASHAPTEQGDPQGPAWLAGPPPDPAGDDEVPLAGWRCAVDRRGDHVPGLRPDGSIVCTTCHP
jgi:hypothetical protein